MIPDMSSAGLPLTAQNEGDHAGLVWPRYSRFEGSHSPERAMEALFRQSHGISKHIASAGDSPVEQTYGEPDEHGDIQVIGDRSKGGWREAMNYVSPSTWGSLAKPPINEPDNVMAFPAHGASYARRPISAAGAFEFDCGDSISTMEIPPGGVEPIGHAGMVIDDCGNSKCIRLKGSDACDISSPRIYGGEGENLPTMMSMPEVHQEGWSNGLYIGSSRSGVVLGSPDDISREDWLYVADAMLHPNIY